MSASTGAAIGEPLVSLSPAALRALIRTAQIAAEDDLLALLT